MWLGFTSGGNGKRFVMYCIRSVVLLLDPLSLMLCVSWKGCEAIKDVLCIFSSVGIFQSLLLCNHEVD